MNQSNLKTTPLKIPSQWAKSLAHDVLKLRLDATSAALLIEIEFNKKLQSLATQ